ncbi:AAA family ATPase [Candidatus Uhrbacteria bacterium]|nr:AAA family ATPase [Candidatus Uhrbacteria bacterium]
MPKLIIGLVGRQGSGKGTVTQILQEMYKVEVFRFSSVLNTILERLAIKQTRDNLIKLSGSLRETFGEDVLSYSISRDVINSSSDIVIVDGIRRIEDIAALDPLPQFKLIEVTAPAKFRYERMTMRGEKAGESTMTYDEFTTQELAPTENTIPLVAALAWKVLNNGKDKQYLEQQVKDLMNELGAEPQNKSKS